MRLSWMVCKWMGHRWRRGMIVKTCRRCGVEVKINKRGAK